MHASTHFYDIELKTCNSNKTKLHQMTTKTCRLDDISAKTFATGLKENVSTKKYANDRVRSTLLFHVKTVNMNTLIDSDWQVTIYNFIIGTIVSVCRKQRRVNGVR